MNDQDIINFKLSLAKAWLENGHEDMARSIITKLINDRIEQTDSI